MRACMVAYTFYESDNRVRRYAEALVRRGDSVDVIALSHPERPDRREINGVRVYNVQKRKPDEKGKLTYLFRTTLFLIRSCIALTLRHIRKPYQLVHVHSVPDYEVFAATIVKLLGAKVILDMHDLVPEFYAAKFSNGAATPLYRALLFIERLCCSFSDHVIISNDLWAEKVVGRSVNRNKCMTILNYPDPAIFHRRNAARLTWHPFTLIYPGSLNWHQGLDIAIRAVAQVRKEPLAVEFHVYGRGPEESTLRAIVEHLNLNDIVKFHGLLSLEEMAKRMEAADAGLVPKRADGFGNEAFSTKIFEFMALDVPVIVSRTKIDQYYFDDSLVMFFEPGSVDDCAEKISSCIRDRGLALQRAHNAAPFIREHSWDRKQEMYFNLVDSLVVRA
ncbi:MAG: hypothetical protein A2268_11195 [Candidatus Raymondbacteria bacterium RifOxyA12_full_50_37]|uniref:Uncharacterized protein n=1 Tax=Candidatus Raymondbacteria bacterium RIFOXYD12_FULL_49_13 TaxID=1817890 RepID=A0A1F7F7J5_UNCRA|nr:MAG: hypothetical protein A2268_11195 [Candidatus Raymondbacteria bacterium RifOxyA12_full_50_37]OGJ85572.1 MAG: hypothetical protein A2248_12980 [Candidatus Raymondbacteria bacterium RIFOXYA2_FULL_49_16]OGJ92824.1 MAG: hypothetical protein A2350_16930 [Candidatus Raymondbacteria bacterium RifOxyB12_full_50_8]OGJ93167.1 MAG: hypothetical protein A2487_08965 [Candidatus Raymondbacteria bacterium RifOxyC12_full_50_8]OGJ95075.1 MAG: hypothetical protein A2453_07680 [Candidatus Raymondbacteria b